MRPTHRLPLAVLLVGALAACGGRLSESEVLARSATELSSAQAERVSGAPGVTTDSTVAGSTPSGSGTGTGSATPGGATGAAAAATATGATDTSTTCKTGATGPISVATVGNYSGAGGSAQGGFPPAVQAWAADINSRGGLCGREVRVVVQDDGGDQARYGSLVRDSVENRKVVAFVGNGAVLSGAGGLAYHRTSGVPVIGNDCTNAFWYDSPALFPTCSAPYDQASSAVRHGADVAGTKKFGYVYCTEAKTCLDVDANLQAGGAREAGVDTLYRDSVSIAQVDFTAECQAARGAGVELLWVAADPATVSRMVQSCSRQNYFPKYMCGSVSCGTTTFGVRGFESAALETPVFPFAGGSGGALDEYERVRSTFAADITPGVDFSIGWTSAKLFELAATKAAVASGEITSKSLIDALYSLEDETLGGLTPPMNFGPTGAKPKNCYFGMQGDGKGGFTLPKGPQAICR